MNSKCECLNNNRKKIIMEKEEKVFSFEGLEVYNTARILVRDIYRLQHKFPKYETYALGDQIRRSASSVTSNIAEGSGRNSFKEKSHFIEIAYGSLMEVFSQLDIACDLGYISQEEFEQMEFLINEEAKMLSGLIAKRKQSIAQRPKTCSIAS